MLAAGLLGVSHAHDLVPIGRQGHELCILVATVACAENDHAELLHRKISFVQNCGIAFCLNLFYIDRERKSTGNLALF
jgi:hypothetical protein